MERRPALGLNGHFPAGLHYGQKVAGQAHQRTAVKIQTNRRVR